MSTSYQINYTFSNNTTLTGTFTIDFPIDDPATPTLSNINLVSSDGGSFTNLAFANLNVFGDQVTLDYADEDGNFLDINFNDAGLDAVGVNIIGFAYTQAGSVEPLVIGSGTVGPVTPPACFVFGMLIDTPAGSVRVEDLQVGASVLTQDGREVGVKWVGRQKIHEAFAGLLNALPICIKAGALKEGVPVRDLYVSPDHAMYLDEGVLVHAGALVNGRTIYQVTEWAGDVEYFHIETENHEIILAEGAPAETFMDNVSRKMFYNYAEYEALYPNAKPMVELDLPRVKYARQLARAIKLKLDVIADSMIVVAEKVA